MNPISQAENENDPARATSVYDALLRAGRAHGGKTAFAWIETGAPEETALEISFDELLGEIARSANLFRALGVGRNDAVAYLMPSLMETHFVLWGAETAGIACPVNFLLQPEQIADLVRAAGAKLLVAPGPGVGADIWQKALAVRDLVPGLTLVKVGPGKTEPGVVDFFERLNHAAEPAFQDLPGLDSIAAYFHTGGTTGAPKLVKHTHRNQLAAALGALDIVGIRASDVVTNGLPLFHVGGTIFCSLSNLLAGAQTLILSGQGFRNPAMVSNFWRIIEKYRVTVGGAVPTALGVIAKQAIGSVDISSLRMIMSGAAALPSAVADEVEAATGHAVFEVYGMTETGGVIAVDSPQRGKVRGAVGFAITSCLVEIRRLAGDGAIGERCGLDESGVLVLKGPNVMPGYKDESHNAGVFTADGWFISGDIGHTDADGRIYLTGRSKDLIIRGGHNIEPSMIEDAFLLHPDVFAAAAVSMPDAYAGELPVAYVVLNPGAQTSVEELRAHAERHINERPAYPKKIFIVEKIPLTGVGKVYKPALRNDCAGKLFAEVLDGEPIRSLAVTEDPKRGRIVGIALDDQADSAGARARIVGKIKPYLATVEWTAAPAAPRGRV